MTDPGAFQQFQPSVNYPRPNSRAVFITTSAPTNSWAQGNISNILDSDRVIKNIPWYVLPNYIQNSGIGLCHILNHNTSVIFSNGNISAINVPSPKIRILGVLKLKKYGSMYTEYSIGDSVAAFFVRGSPYATFKYSNEIIKIKITEGGATSLISSLGNTKHVVKISDVLVYSSNEKLLLRDDGTFISDKLAIYEYLTPITKVIASYNGKETQFKFVINNTDVNVIVQSEKHIITDVADTLVTKTGHWDDKSSVFGITFTISNDTSTYTYTYDFKLHIATITRSKPYTYQIVIYTPISTMLALNNNVITSINSYNGFVMIAHLPDEAVKLEDLYDENHILLLKSSDIVGYGTNYYDLKLDYDHSNLGSTIILLPSHWSNYTFSTLTKVNSPYKLIDITYGELEYYTIKSKMISNTIKVTFPNFTPKEDIDISTLTLGERDALIKRVKGDATFTDINVDTNPYSYGQQAAAAGRICLLAFNLGVSDISINKLKNKLENTLVSWFTNTNSKVFRLSYDIVWGGIVVPADDLHQINKTNLTAFGNSYYNDHHFHYGYILYATWCLMKLGSNIAVLYSKQIHNLIYDVCNPFGSSFSTKMRHKDFYAGHSWATGVPFPGTNPLDRQQESSSEAINCYYSVYLVAKELGLVTVKNAARVALKTEIDASHSYYQLQNPEEGIFSELPGVGIVQLLGKGYTLDWVMQPNTFPGRSIGIYGIQSIPITEISFILLSTFSTKIQTSTPDYYSVTSSLVRNLTDSIYTPKYPPGDSKFNVKKQGGFWGNVGMMLITPSSINRSEIWVSWLNLLNKQKELDGTSGNIKSNTAIKNFDSYSNTLYWLIMHSVFRSTGNEFNGHFNKFKVYIYLGGTCIKAKYKESTRKLTMNNFKIDLFDLIIGKDDYTLAEKALNLDVHPDDIIKYVVTKITLIDFSCDLDLKKDINSLLTRSANTMVIKSIRNGPVCKCLSELKAYIGFEKFFI